MYKASFRPQKNSGNAENKVLFRKVLPSYTGSNFAKLCVTAGNGDVDPVREPHHLDANAGVDGDLLEELDMCEDGGLGPVDLMMIMMMIMIMRRGLGS